jgi:hypothetical protein
MGGRVRWNMQVVSVFERHCLLQLPPCMWCFRDCLPPSSDPRSMWSTIWQDVTDHLTWPPPMQFDRMMTVLCINIVCEYSIDIAAFLKETLFNIWYSCLHTEFLWAYRTRLIYCLCCVTLCVQQATAIAIHMVKDWGMSEKVGLRTHEGNNSGFVVVNELSPSTNDQIDSEIKRIMTVSIPLCIHSQPTFLILKK